MDEKKPAFIPNSTQIPNILIDFVFPHIPFAERACLLYICRRTYGFRKKSDRISLTQFVKGIKGKDGKQLDYGAVGSRKSAERALKNLRESGAVTAKKTTKGTFYEIDLSMDVASVINKIQLLREQDGQPKTRQTRLFQTSKVSSKMNQFTFDDTSIAKNEPEVSPKIAPQYKGNKEKLSIAKASKLASNNKNKPKLPTNALIGAFSTLCQAIRGTKPVITPFKDGNLIKWALRHLNEGQIQILFAWFLKEKRGMQPTIGAALSKAIVGAFFEAAQKEYGFYLKYEGILRQHILSKTQEQAKTQEAKPVKPDEKQREMVDALGKLALKMSLN